MRRMIIEKVLKLIYAQAKEYVSETSTEVDNQVLNFLAKVINDFLQEEVLPVEGVAGRHEAVKTTLDGLHEICGDE